jgi:hypothetical protein
MAMERLKSGDFPETLEALRVYFFLHSPLEPSDPFFVSIDRSHCKQWKQKRF